MKTGIKVYDAMTRRVISVSPNETAKSCALRMREHNVGCLMICEDKKIKGVITEQGLVHKIVARGLNPETVKVSRIMKKRVASVSPKKDLYEALKIMQQKEIRQLAVIEGKKIIGIITVRDILKIQPDLFDIWKTKIELREESRKLSSLDSIEGTCEFCGNYTKLFDVDSQLICVKCMEKR